MLNYWFRFTQVLAAVHFNTGGKIETFWIFLSEQHRIRQAERQMHLSVCHQSTAGIFQRRKPVFCCGWNVTDGTKHLCSLAVEPHCVWASVTRQGTGEQPGGSSLLQSTSCQETPTSWRHSGTGKSGWVGRKQTIGLWSTWWKATNGWLRFLSTGLCLERVFHSNCNWCFPSSL